MYKLIYLPIIFLVALFGCSNSQTNNIDSNIHVDPNRHVFENEIPDYKIKLSENTVGIYSNHWVQPINKTEPCRILIEGYIFDGIFNTSNYPEYNHWDGNCIDGKANGLGKVTSSYDTFEVYEVTILSGGITNREFYHEKIGSNLVQFGQYWSDNNKLIKKLITTSTIDSAHEIVEANSWFQQNLINNSWSGIRNSNFNGINQSDTGIFNNGLFFGVKKQSTSLNENATMLGFFNENTQTQDSFSILINKNGVFHSRYEFGALQENVWLPNSYLTTIYRVASESANTANVVRRVSENALLMKKKYDELHSNLDQSIDRKNIVRMFKSGGVYEIPVELNDVLKIAFILDSGASEVLIAPDVALTLYRTGTIKDSDFLQGATYRFANGSVAKSSRFLLKSIQIGNKKLINIPCAISDSLSAPMLLGQSALEKLGKFSIDYNKGTLIFE